MPNHYTTAISKVVDYIYKSTDKQLSIQELAEVANFSKYHFHRIFTAYTGESLTAFVKRIRLEKSATMLTFSNTNITEIALAYGYETPSAYTKAFKNQFGINPSEYKIAKKQVFATKNSTKYQNNLRRIIMDNFVGIKELEDLNVISVSKTGNYTSSACAAWSELCKFAYSKKLLNQDTKMIGVGYDSPNVTAEENLRYDACFTVKVPIAVEGNVVNNTITGGKYAVFLHKGAYEKLNDTYSAIFTQWLPSSNYKLRNLPLFDVYLNKNPARTKPENLRTEIYVPIE